MMITRLDIIIRNVSWCRTKLETSLTAPVLLRKAHRIPPTKAENSRVMAMKFSDKETRALIFFFLNTCGTESARGRIHAQATFLRTVSVMLVTLAMEPVHNIWPVSYTHLTLPTKA